MGRLAAIAAVILSTAVVHAESPGLPDAATTIVTSIAELRAAMLAAQPGDIIELAPGTYAIDQTLSTPNAGTAGEPIIVRAGGSGSVLLESTVVEAIHVTQPFWQFQHLELHGVCADDSTCEHAFHITGNADSTTVADCRLVDFNAQIKGNGDLVGPGGTRVWPDDVVITRTEFFDTRPRQTANPVTKIDVVGGRRWRLEYNDIHDFEKAQGDTVSYAAFLKGNSRDGEMKGNRVVCAQAFTGGTRIGLSLGGGGSGPDPICEDGTCTPEHQNGVIHDNVIAHCSDVGIYLNEAMGTKIFHNTIYDTAGVDVRFATSTAEVQANLIGGALRDRDGGAHTSANDLVGITPAEWTAWFTDPAMLEFNLLDGSMLRDHGAVIAGYIFDLCGNDRDDGQPDLGAYEYDDDLVDPNVPCVFRPGQGPDAGGPVPDAGGPGNTGDGGGCCGTSADPRGCLLLVALLALAGRASPARGASRRARSG